MKKIILITKIAFLSSTLISQNLVPNHSFEVLSPFGNISEWGYSNLEQVAFFRDGQTTSSQDFFGEVDPWSGNYNVITISLGVPDNYFGYETPHHGQRYAGFWSQRIKGGTGTISSNRTGKLYVELSSPLIKDMTYVICYAVSKMDHSNKTPKYEVFIATNASGSNKKSIYKGNVHTSDEWDYVYHEFTPDISELKYLIFEGDNFFLSEYFAGIYLDNVLVVDKCTYDGWDCYCGHDIITPYFNTVISDYNNCFKIYNLNNVLKAEIKIYNDVSQLLWTYSVCSDNCISDPIMWNDYGAASGQYSADVKLYNHCYVWEQTVNFQKWTPAHTYCHDDYQPLPNYDCVGLYIPYPNCEPNIFLYGKERLINEQIEYSATNQITAGNNIIISSEAEVSFKAGNKIVLRPGFKVEYGATFVASIDITNKSLITENDNNWKYNENTDLLETNKDKQNESYLGNNFISIHPNPFTNSFTISISQTEQTDVRIFLTDAYGRQILSIYDGFMNSGHHTIDVSTDGIYRGLYFCIIETQHNRKVVKVVKM